MVAITPELVRQLRRRADKEDIHPVRDVPGAPLMLELLDRRDAAREQLEVLSLKLILMLMNGDAGAGYESTPKLTPVELKKLGSAWAEFKEAGGQTGGDFQRFLRGQPVRPGM
jgi:hypothetical protein